MIQEHELRIGNLVLIPYNKSNKKEGFYQARIEKIGEFGSYIKPEDYEPILLTEEWLLKFGFKKTEWDNSNSYSLKTDEDDYSIVIYSNGNVEIEGIFIRKLDYIHELQNFYWGLKSKELTLKE
jgi:hypothetical protein